MSNEIEEIGSESEDSGKVKGIIDTATELAKAVPVYKDAVQPAAQQVGKSLETVAKAVNVALSPIRAMIWGYDKIKEFVDKTVSEKLKDVPNEQIQTPDPHVAGPALEALKYTGENETLTNMFANLLANSMDSETAKKAHPAFTDIIKNMTSDEAKILEIFVPDVYKPIMDVKVKKKTGDRGEYNLLENYSAIGQEAGCQHLELVPNYIDNLIRLGLLIIPSGRKLIGDNAYDKVTDNDEYRAVVEMHENEQTTTVEIKKYIELTSLGRQFREACVIDKNT